MAGFSTTNATVLMRDYLEPAVRGTFQEEDNTFRALMDMGTNEKVNSRGRRISFRVQSNPSYGSPLEGAYMPQPGAPLDVEANIKYLNQFKTGEFTGDIRDLDGDNAIVSYMARNQKDDVVTFNHTQNFLLFGTGTGSHGVVTGVASPNVTFSPTATDYGSRQIMLGARMQFFSSAGVQRVGGGITTSVVVANTESTGVVQCDAIPTDVAATDVIVYENSYGRATHGFPYHIDDASSMWLGINRGAYPTLKGVVHDAAGGALTAGMIDLVQLKAKRRGGTNVPINDFVMISHPTQKNNYRQLGYALNRTVQASGNARLDLGFPEVAHNGMRWREDLDCAPSDIWGLRFSSWAIEFVRLPGFYEFNEGQKIIQKPGSGIYADAFQYAIYARYDLVCKDPRQNFRLKNLPYTVGTV